MIADDGGSRCHSSLSLPKEVELVVACCSASSEAGKRIRSLAAGDLHWPGVTSFANDHHVLPLVWRSLSREAADLLPEQAHLQLRQRSHENALHSLLLARELVRLSRVLGDEGVPLLAYKGPALAAALYGDVTLRQFADLDILVRQRDVERALEILHGQDYLLEVDAQQRLDQQRNTYHVALGRSDRRVYLELHWGLSFPTWALELRPKQLFANAVVVPLGDGEVFAPHPEDLVIALAVHGCKDAWRRLLWICDIAQLLHPEMGLDWQRVLRRASQLGCRRMVTIALLMARDLLDAQVPDQIADALADPKSAGMAGRYAVQALTGSPQGLDHSDLELALRERARDRATYFVRWLVPRLRYAVTPNEKDVAVLGRFGRLPGLAYLARPFRLLATRPEATDAPPNDIASDHE